MKKVILSMVALSFVVNVFGEGKSCFSLGKGHLSAEQIEGRECIDKAINALGSGDNNCPEVAFQIEYLNKLKGFLTTEKTADEFAMKLIGTYPNLAGYENIRGLASALYPNEVVCPEVIALKDAMNAYFESVSTGDEALIKGIWAKDSRVSLVNGRGHFIGLDSLLNDFFPALRKNNKGVKLYSSVENVTVLSETSALIELYWVFERSQDDGSVKTGRGRESLIFKKIDGKWSLVHVHYSPLPQ